MLHLRSVCCTAGENMNAKKQNKKKNNTTKRDFEPTFLELFRVIVVLQIFQEHFGFLGLCSSEQFKINGVLKVFKSTSI